MCFAVAGRAYLGLELFAVETLRRASALAQAP